MADEPAPDAGELDPNAAPEDGATDPNNAEPNPIEDLASKMGWSPQDQFRGPAEEWKPADQFILAGKDINRTLSRELRGMRDQIDRVTRTSAQILEDKLAEKDAYWQNVHAKAVDEGDGPTAKRASDELIKLATSKPAASETSEPPETAEFRRRNAAWFGVDDLATVRAMEIAEQMHRLGKPAPAQLEAVERVIRKEFPELFKAAGKQPPATQTATSRNAVTSSKVKGFNDMPAESQAMARDYERRHGMKVEDFAKSYWADQAKRRVG